MHDEDSFDSAQKRVMDWISAFSEKQAGDTPFSEKEIEELSKRDIRYKLFCNYPDLKVVIK